MSCEFFKHPGSSISLWLAEARRQFSARRADLAKCPICPTCGSFAEGGPGGKIALGEIAGRKCCSVPDPAHRRLAEDVRFPVTSGVERDPTQFDAPSTR